MMRDKNGADTIDLVVQIMGSRANAARALNVAGSTITRWLSGENPLEGAALVAARAIIKHPGEYRDIAQQKRSTVGRRSNNGGD